MTYAKLPLVSLLWCLAWSVPECARAQLIGGRSEARDCAVAVGGNADRAVIQNICGVSTEVLDAIRREFSKAQQDLRDSNGDLRRGQQDLRDLNDELKARAADLKARLDLTDGQFRAAFEAFGEKDIPPSQQLAKLIEIAGRYREMRGANQLQPGDTPAVVELRAKADALIRAGDAAQADAALADVEAEQRRNLDQLALNVAATNARRGEIALTRLQYNAAAQRFAEAAFTVGPGNPAERAGYLERQADALYQQGDEFGDAAALDASIRVYRQLLDLFPRATKPTDWARIQSSLGAALNTAGSRSSGTEWLQQSVDAYRAALTVLSRTDSPADWAAASNSLATTLADLADKSGSVDLLQEAITILRQLLAARPHDHAPLEWAVTQANIGGVLLTLGRGAGGTTADLKGALEAYREALREATRQTAPATWASIQNNLGITLSELARRENDPARSKEAVAAFNEALKERPRSRYPVDWATTQYNLASTWSTIAESEPGTRSLEEAVTAYREALTELTRQSAGMFWARAQTNLGNALFRLGKAGDTVDTLRQAAAAYREAAKEWTRETSPLDWALEQGNIGDALFEVAKRESGTADLEDAVAAYGASLEIRTQWITRKPLAWAETQRDWCFALWTLGYRTQDERQKTTASVECRKGHKGLAAILAHREGLPSDYVERATVALGTLSYFLVLMRDHTDALAAADQAQAVSPEARWIRLNRAHALMFLRRTDEARRIYLDPVYLEPSRTNGGDAWKRSVRTDFGELRSAGLDDPLMREVEAGLSIR